MTKNIILNVFHFMINISTFIFYFMNKTVFELILNYIMLMIFLFIIYNIANLYHLLYKNTILISILFFIVDRINDLSGIIFILYYSINNILYVIFFTDLLFNDETSIKNNDIESNDLDLQ